MRVAAMLLSLTIVVLAQDTGTLHGTVVDPDSKPLANRTVTAHCVSTERPLGRVVKTDKRGFFRFEKLPAGSYILELGERGQPPKKDDGSIGAVVAKELFGALAHAMRRANADGHPHLVKVRPLQEVRHDYRVPRRLPVTVVVQREGERVRGAIVHLELLNTKGDASWSASVGGTGRKPRTDKTGSVTFPSVPEGRYGIFLDYRGWQVSCGVHVVQGKEPVRIPLSLGPHTIRIRLLDARGKPVTTAGIRVAGNSEWTGVGPSHDLRSPIGVYEVRFVAEGRYRPHANQGWSNASGPPVEVGPKAPNPIVELRLPATGWLVVRILDKWGRAVPGVRVYVKHPTERAYPGGETNSKGEHRVEVPAHSWLVCLEDPDRILKPQGKAKEIDVRPFTTTTVELQRP